MTKKRPSFLIKFVILFIIQAVYFFNPNQPKSVLAASQNIFGINRRDGNWETPTVQQWMKETGATYIRASVNWSSWQPSKNSPIDLRGLDSYMQTMIDGGMTPVVYVTGAPPDVSTYPGGPYNLVTGDTTYISQFMRALVSRYNGGTLVNGRLLPRIDWWQMYNEPDSLVVGTDSWDATSYADMLRAVYPSIKEANPNAKLIFGVAAENTGTFAMDFTNRVLARLKQYSAQGFDALDLHYYPAWHSSWDSPSANDYWLTAKVNHFRSLLRNYGFSTPIVMTETGRKSRQTEISGEPASEKAQGNWFWKAHTQAMHGNLPFIILFSVNDTGPGISDSWGILNRSFTTPAVWSKKRSYDSYRRSVSILGDLTYRRRVDTILGVEAHVLTKPNGTPVTVFWSREPAIAHSIDFSVVVGGSLTTHDIYGIPTERVDTGNGAVRVSTADPMYADALPVGVTLPSLLTPTPTPTPSPFPTLTPLPSLTATPSVGRLQGDANNDGKVDGTDYIIWLNHIGVTNPNGPNDGDFNSDNKVDGTDYVIWLNHSQAS